MAGPFRALVSMELDDEEKAEQCQPSCDKPDFPYGLRISLTEKEFERLGLNPADAECGAIFHGHFMARVTSVYANDGASGATCRVEAQIEDLAIESEDEEDEDA
jgi:hypothetical protein